MIMAGRLPLCITMISLQLDSVSVCVSAARLDQTLSQLVLASSEIKQLTIVGLNGVFSTL